MLLKFNDDLWLRVYSYGVACKCFFGFGIVKKLEIIGSGIEGWDWWIKTDMFGYVLYPSAFIDELEGLA